MERQSTSKLFKIVIAIVAFFVLCSSALLFASCGVSKDDGHEHVYPETPNATVPATCGTPGYIVYECTECGEQFKVEISLATGKHTFDENDVCTKCGMTKTQADLLTQAAFKSAIDDLKNTLGTLATGAQLQGLNDLSQAQVKTLTDALETALKAAITNAQTAITDAVGGTGSDSAKTAILQAIQDALEDINGEEATSVQSVLKAEIAKQTAKIEEYNTKLDGLKTSLEAAQGEAKNEIIKEIDETNEAIESAKDAIVAAVSAAQTSIEGKLDDLDEKVGTAQTTLSGEIGNVKTVVDGIQEALKALNDLAKTTDVKEVKTLVEEFQRTLTTTLTEKFGSIDSEIKALTNSESGIAASVNKNTDAKLEALKGELETLINTGTSQGRFDEVVSKIAEKITDAFDTFKQTMSDTLDEKLEGILTQSHFDTELGKVTETLGEIKTKVNEALDKKLSEVETSIGTAQEAILAAIEKMAGSEEEGEGPVLPTIKGWVQQILFAITGDPEYNPLSASAMSLSEKPLGMQNQIADLWDKAVELQEALTTLSGSLTTLSGSVSNLPNKTEMEAYFAQLKTDLEKEQATYASNLTTLNGTLSSVSEKVDDVQSYLEDTLYKQLETMDGKLDELVSRVGEFYNLFTELRAYAQKHYQDLGGKTWEEVFNNVLNTYGAYFQQLPDYLGKLKGWDDIIDSIIEFAKKEGIVNEAGGLEVGNFTKAVDTLKYVYDFLGVGDALEGGRYAQKTVTTLAGLVDLLNTINGNTDELEGKVSDLADKFKDIDNDTLKAALNALTGDKNTEGSLNQLADLLGQLPDNTEIKQLFVEALGAGDDNYDLVGKLGALIDTKFTEYKDRYQSYIDLAKEYIKIANQLKGIFDKYGIENLQKLVDWAFEERQNLKALVEAGTNLKELASNQQAIVEAATKWNEFLKSQDLADIIAAAGAINDEKTGIKALAGLIGDLNGAVEGLPNSEAIVEAFKAALADLTVKSDVTVEVDTSKVIQDLKDQIKALLNKVLPEGYQNNWDGLASLAQDFVELVIDLKDSIFTDKHGVEQLAQLADWAFENRGSIKALVANADGFVDLVDGETGVLARLDKVLGENGFGKVDELSEKLGEFTAESTLKNYLDKVFGGNSAAGAHQHNWVMRPAQGIEPNVYEPASASDNIKLDCLAEKHYVWLCTICGEYQKVNGDYVVETVAPTGHVTDWTHGLNDKDHPEVHVDPTCVNPGRVEAYCVVCGEYTGQWTNVESEPATGKHVWVKETTENQTGEHNTCTGIHSYVMHCVTCGGAYTEQVNTPGSMGPDGKVTYHDYYSALDVNGKPNGTKLTDEEKEALYRTYAEVNDIEPDGDGKYEDVLTPQQKYEALEANLNKVWDSPATCVEPALTVVECVDCGVRYAYANGTPKGHDFMLHLGQGPTCTMDGNKSYAFCPDCGYYFEIPETVKVSTLSFTAPTFSDGKYHYNDKEITAELAKWLNDNAYSKDYAPKGGTAFKGADNEAAHAYFANGKEATGHKYVVVYTNIPNCVTAPTYMLVCETCFKVGDKSFKDLVEVEGTPNPDALFYQEAAEEGVVGKYWVKGLSGSETGGINAAADQEKVGAIIGEADPADSDLAKQVAKYVKDAEDANADANVKAEAKAKLVEWILKYGVRDGGNKWTAEELSAMDVAALEDLIDTEIGENYKSNVVKDASFVLPVKGHTFNDVVTTVVGVCVMYPRHQYFCSVCGQGAVDPSFTTSAGDTEVPKLGSAKVPYFVTGKADAAMAYTVPEEKVTDLEKDWNKVSAEGAKVDDVLNWLGQYGYLNDFRENIATPWNKTELETVTKSIKAYFGIDVGQDLKVDDITGLFTGENVLNEYIDNKDSNGDVKPIGHTFDLAIQLDAESCNKPGSYVYVCSVCGMVDAWEDGDSSDHATGEKQPSWWKGLPEVKKLLAELDYIEYEMGDEHVTTNVKLLPNALEEGNKWTSAKSKYYYLYDGALDGSNTRLNANIPTGRTDIEKSDLVRSWEAAQASTSKDTIFAWLLEHGYLNNVIDTVIEMARADLADANNYNIAQKATEEPDWADYYEYTAQDIYNLAYAWWNGTETITPEDATLPVNVLATMADIFNKTQKIENEIQSSDLELNDKTKTTILGLVINGGDVGETGETLTGILGDKDLSVFYTKKGETEYSWSASPSNSTWVPAATPIPVSGHVYTKEDGSRFDEHNDPKCLDFASEELTKHYKANELIYWDGDSWEVCGKFNPEDLDPEFKAQADKYGILAACKRENCPLHGTKQDSGKYDGVYKPGETDEKKFTAGYVAAQDHEMSYEKLAPVTEGAYAGTHTPSETVKDANLDARYRIHYNMKTVEDYEGADLDAQQKAMDADYANLYTLQKIYFYQHLGEEKCKELGFEYLVVDPSTEVTLSKEALASGEKVKLDIDWMPLTRAVTAGEVAVYDSPSCWVRLQCKWYHNPIKHDDGSVTYDTRCNKADPIAAHTYPKAVDWCYDDLKATCWHGDRCLCCDWDFMNEKGHTLTNVEDLKGEKMNQWWEDLFAAYKTTEAYTSVYGDRDYTWEEFSEATCCDNGYELFLCTGELELYGTEKLDKMEGHGWVPCTAEWKEGEAHVHSEGATYCLHTLAMTGEHAEHTSDNVFHYAKNNAKKEISNEEWNNGFNKYVCTTGYTEVFKCNNTNRKGEQCTYEQTLADEAKKNHTFAPIENYWEFSSDSFKPTTVTHDNAYLTQVCVYCGLSMKGVYKDYASGVNGDTTQQFNVTDDEKLIENWNVNGKPDPSYPVQTKYNATTFRPEDYKPQDGIAGEFTNNNDLFADGNYIYDEDAELKLTGTGLTQVTGNSHVLIKKDAKLSIDTSSLPYKDWRELTIIATSTHRAQLIIEGEVDNDGKPASELDLSKVSQVNVNNSKLVLKNLNVTDLSLLPSVGAEIIIENCVVTYSKTGGVIGTNANYANSTPVKITINKSTIASSGAADTALVLTQANATLEATDSVFYGAENGVAIRCGNATFTGCTFITSDEPYTGAWGSGTQIPANAALVVGSQNGNYGHANVTLKGGCEFKIAAKYEDIGGATTEFSKANMIGIYSVGENSATVTADVATNENVTKAPVEEGPSSTYKCLATIEALGEKPAEAAAELVAEFVAKNGVLVLPDGIGTITVAEESPLTVTGQIELNLADNTLNAKKGFIVNGGGDLYIEGGTIEAGTNGSSQAIAVKDGGKVTLVGTELTLTDCMEGASTYGIYGEANTAITVAESTIYNNYGPAIGTNAHQGPVTLVLTDSSFFSDMPLGKEGKNSTDSTSVGLLLNNKDSELFAGGCLFYGTNAAAWIRGGKAMFAGCTFVSGGVARANEQWYSGAGFKGEAQAAVVIGNGNDTAYGNVEVEIIDCEVSFTTVNAETAPKTPEAIATTSLEKIPEETTKDYNKNTWALPDSKGETGKTMTIVAVSTTTTTVSFSDEATATKFIGTELKKGDNVFMYGDANIGNFNVSYQKEVPPTEEGLDPTYETVKIDITVETTAEGASSDLEDVAENGGKIVLPAVEEGDIEMESKLVVGSDTTIDLNGNKLKGDVSVEDGASLKIEGGTYEGGLSALAPERGEGSQVTLEDVTTKNDGRFGIFVGPTDDAGSSVKTKIVVTITDSRLEGNIGLFVNGRMDGAIINITNSAILGNNGCGLSVCGEAEVDATNSVFFGSATAVQMASGTGTFTDCTFVSANDNFGVTEFGENTSIPTATLGNFVINSRGGGYNYPVNVTLAGENTKFITAKMDDGSKYTVKDILVEVSTETKKIALNWTSSDGMTNLIGYYEVDKTPAQKVTVTVVEANPSADSAVRVNLTNTTDNDLTLKVGTNVFVWTDNKTAKDDVAIEAVQAMVKGVEIAAKD